jgi:putative transposase
MSDRKAYPSDLRDAEWEILESLIPALSPLVVNVMYTRREIVNGILYLYVLRSGCPWRMVPNDLPAWGTLYDSFRAWCNDVTWDKIQKSLLKRFRKAGGRDARAKCSSD